MKQISEIMEEAVKNAMQSQDEMIVDDVIDIYNGKYKDYGSYLKEKELLNELIDKQANEKLTIRLKVLLLPETMFNYIKNTEK